jgi:hypothetical protein
MTCGPLRPELTFGEPFGDESYTNDFQYFIILDEYLNLIQVLITTPNARSRSSLSMCPTISAAPSGQFGLRRRQRPFAMFLDDVVLDACK